MSQFATISSDTGEGTYPEPAATFVKALGVTNLELLGFVPLGCVVKDVAVDFYHTVLFKASFPLFAIVVLSCYPLSAALRGHSSDTATKTVKRLAMLLLELALPSIATSLVQVFLVSGAHRATFALFESSSSYEPPGHFAFTVRSV